MQRSTDVLGRSRKLGLAAKSTPFVFQGSPSSRTTLTITKDRPLRRNSGSGSSEPVSGGSGGPLFGFSFRRGSEERAATRSYIEEVNWRANWLSRFCGSEAKM